MLGSIQLGILVEGVFWWRKPFGGRGVLRRGRFWGGGVLVAFGSSRCLGRGAVLVEVVFWCWLKGRFGGASLLMDGGGVLVEGAFWCRGRFGGRDVSVEEVCW